MAVTTTTTISNTIQTYYTKQLIAHAVQRLRLNQFAMTRDLPSKRGAKSIRFFRRVEASASNVQSLTEATPISTFTGVTYTPVDVTLNQYGEASRISDIAIGTELMDLLNDHIQLMSEDCALHADGITRDVLVAGITTAGQRRYAGTATTYAGLQALSQANGKMTYKDVLAAATKLKDNRAPLFSDGCYVMVNPPQVNADLMYDSTIFIPLTTYSSGAHDKLYKGEIGKVYGVKIVEATNPFQEEGSLGTGLTEGVEDTAAGAETIYSCFVTGYGAYGTPRLAGFGSKVPQSDVARPQLIMVDKADSANPLKQYTTVGWKSYWGASVLNENFICNVKAKSEYAED